MPTDRNEGTIDDGSLQIKVPRDLIQRAPSTVESRRESLGKRLRWISIEELERNTHRLSFQRRGQLSKRKCFASAWRNSFVLEPRICRKGLFHKQELLVQQRIYVKASQTPTLKSLTTVWKKATAYNQEISDDIEGLGLR